MTVLDLARPSFPGLGAQGVAAEVRLVEGSIVDPADVREALAGADLVFHLAAQTLVGPAVSDPLTTYRTNIEGTWCLLEACRDRPPEAIVVASSDKAYGPAERLPYREEDELRPVAPYEGSKAACEVIARSYAASRGLPVAVTRLANVYGGGDLNFSRLLPELMAAAVHSRRPEIRSDGTAERDFLHVEDAVAAYRAVGRMVTAGDGFGESFNAGTGTPRSVAGVIEAVESVTGAGFGPGILAEVPPEGEIEVQFVDSTRLEAATGWRPRVGFEQGLNEAFEWYSSHPDLCP